MSNYWTHSLTYEEEFAIYLNYVRKLTFDETPDYDFLRELFSTAMKNNGDEDDGVFDWMKLNDGQGWQKNSVCGNIDALIWTDLPSERRACRCL